MNATKKFFVLYLFGICLILCIIGGCGGKSDSIKDGNNQDTMEPLHVLIDIDVGSNIVEPSVKQALEKYMETDDGFQSFKSTLKELGCPAELELEFAPKEGEERDTYLTRLRTEILAGGGPDVFVCASGPSYVIDLTNMVDGAVGGGWQSPLFQFPQQAAKRSMFLCLDEYVSSSQFTDWSSLPSVIMDAGKYDGKQYLLPMTYTLPMVVFKKSDVQHTHSRDMTWEDMLTSSSELKAAAVLDSSVYIGSALLPMVDPTKDELSFSEQELLEFMTNRAEAKQEVLTEGNLPDYYATSLCVGFDEALDTDTFPTDEKLSLLPMYSRQGGSGATITSFVAVNANTKQPKAAAFLADYFLSEECQRSVLYEYVTSGRSVPTMSSLLQKGEGVESMAGHWTLSEENYEEFCSLRDSIAWAEFNTQLGIELQQLDVDIQDYKKRKSAEGLVHDAYMRMSMELAES